MGRQTQWLFEVPMALGTGREGDRGANLDYFGNPEVAVTPVSEIPKEGSFYQIKKGDTLLRIASKAYGVVPGSELRKLARLINEDPYNLRVRRSEPVDLFPEGIISFYPEFVCGFAAQSQSADKPPSGSCYAIIKIPARRSEPTQPLVPDRWKDVLVGGTSGNFVECLIRGPATFEAMAKAIRTANKRGHYIYLLGWWLDDNFPLIPTDPTSTIQALFYSAANAGVQIRAMLWDTIVLTGGDVRHNTKEVDRINALREDGAKLKKVFDAAAILDETAWAVGSHHQKVLIVKGDKGLIAFCGGVDINRDRVPPAKKAGQPLHDVHCKIQGAAAHELLKVFMRRWTSHPKIWGKSPTLTNLFPYQDIRRVDLGYPLLGLCEPLPSAKGSDFVKIATTSNAIRGGKPCSQDRSLRDTMISVIRNAQRSIYIEDQYLVGLQAARELRKRIPVNSFQSLTIVIPYSSLSDVPQIWKRRKDFLDTLTIGLSPQDRSKVKIYYLRDLDINGKRIFGSYSYVHSKTWIIDDEVAIIGSANCNRRGWSYDTEVIAAIYNPKLASNLHTSLLRLHASRMAPYNPTEDYDRFPPPHYIRIGTVFMIP